MSEDVGIYGGMLLAAVAVGGHQYAPIMHGSHAAGSSDPLCFCTMQTYSMYNEQVGSRQLDR